MWARIEALGDDYRQLVAAANRSSPAGLGALSGAV